jgi:hypothetical protein
MSQADDIHSTTPPEIPGPASEARELLATAIECLIALLDLQEGDPEKEASLGWPNPHRLVDGGADQTHLYPETHDGDNEPSLGWTLDGRPGDGAGDERELDEADSEPSLGWQNEGSQRALRSGRVDDAEPSLASTTCIGSFHLAGSDCGWDQSLWAEGECDEREEEHDGREPDVDAEVDSWPNPMGPEGPVGAKP